MKSVTKYIENVLRLKVNKDKSRIGRPTEIQYLGFAFYYQFQEKKYRMKVPKKSLDKVMKKVRKLTSRKWSVSNSYKAEKIAEVVRGWINYFKIGSILTVSRKLDTVIRYRFRMCIWKHWKNPKTRYKNLVKLGISKKNARCAAEFHGYARVCRTKTVCYAMSNARLKNLVYSQPRNIFVKRDVKLTEPPDAEPHVRWCERSAAKAVSYSITAR